MQDIFISAQQFLQELDEYSINNVAKDIIGVKTELQENQIQMNNLKQTLQELKTKQFRIQKGEIVMQAQQVAGRDNYYDNSNVMANMAVQVQNEERKQAEGRQIVNSIQNDQNQEAYDLIAQMRAKKQDQQINTNNKTLNNHQMNQGPPNDQKI
ncbi:UNKNOWN [Stylonychia lemnae]|uniref:Uncharacterized protein n=1 Tax=Stylonychia lemnae TaxID=5949 RepID=A0A078A6T6_STYLE|nr:UNKNOWN [Stylonychia lemnae]|eukprot:CDW77965.1 UNKNOWN [Stylonychia lemnae]